VSRRAYPVPKSTLDLQATASDPALSAWVSANAGSGKTHVLVRRVIRLMLRDIDPGRILCLTYTRAAAANMSNRVFQTLSGWAMLSDERLAAEIADLEDRPPAPEKLALARRLFARALETPGGLKIQTIHAFCESVLQRFALEANVPAHFQLLDALQEEALFGAARRELLSGAMGAGTPQVSAAVAAVLARSGEDGLGKLLDAILRNRDGLRAFVDRLAPEPWRDGDLFQAFGFASHETASSIAATALPLPGFDPSFLDRFGSAADATGAAKAQSMVAGLGRALAAADPEVGFELLCGAMLSGKGEMFSPVTVAPKKLAALLPDLYDRYGEACAHLLAVRDRLDLYLTLEATGDALSLADWLIGRYERLKAGRGFLDFNDLITRTARLLSRTDASAWVLYKLDQGLDHILIDEAQDTSPDQWAVIRQLADDFFAGASGRGKGRTVFAVGDEKQSIYSFQGAAPESFALTGTAFSAKVRQAEGRFERIRLNLSFRSTEDVLRAVDHVFADESSRRGLTFDDLTIEHSAWRAGAPGIVEVWPSLGAEAVVEPDDWTRPIDQATAPAVRLAEKIASTIDGWLSAGERRADTDERLLPGDIMVLVRRRGSFVNALTRAMKARGIPVAGADRLRLTDHIAVRDLIALGRVLLQPHDDLSLAAVLRSPIFDLPETALEALAARRGGRSLHDVLMDRARADVALETIAAQLRRWSADAVFRRPFDFYSGLLVADGLRGRLVGRLGEDAAYLIDEFLGFALAQEKTGLADLETFLATLETARPEIKREMDQTRHQVRIMTVHASKGLEAPVVFLVDAGAASFHASHQPLLMPFEGGPEDDTLRGYLWRAPGIGRPRALAALEAGVAARADDEYRRLLYVGMTRAEDRLVLCGFHGKTQPGPSTWLSVARRALLQTGSCEEVQDPAFADPRLIFRVNAAPPRRAGDAAGDQGATTELVLPPELLRPLPPTTLPPRPLSPSSVGSLLIEPAAEPMPEGSPVLDALAEPGFALRRGTAIHRLLQVLPDMPEEARDDAARRYLGTVGRDWPPGARQTALAAVSAIFSEPQFAAIFQEGSRAEVAVMGHVEIGGVRRLVSGQIDRVAITPDRVTIVDYKTSRPVPGDADQVPAGQVTQLALYRALLAQLYPGREIVAALLYSEAPRLLPLPAEALDAALARLGVS
jgi:ATP-dependent helicase/nuclease subunit A